MWWLLASSLAMAAPDGHYFPDDVAAKSKEFATAAQATRPKFDAAQAHLSKISKALAALDLGVALLGQRASDDLYARAMATRRSVTGHFLELQKFTSLLQEDFSKSFNDALDRALKTVAGDRDVVECGAGGVAAMLHPVDCPGEDLNGALAAAIDADPKLQKDVDEILALQWPAVTVTPQPLAAAPLVPGGRADGAWIQAAPVAEALVGDRIEARKKRLETELAPLEPAIHEGEPAALAKAQDLRAAYEDDLGALGDELWAEVSASLARAVKKGEAPQVSSICANPPSLGGCPGKDVTQEALAWLQADKKLARKLAK